MTLVALAAKIALGIVVLTPIVFLLALAQWGADELLGGDR